MAEPQPAATMVRLMARNNLWSNHQARPVTDEAVANANLVLVMTKNHAEALKTAFPEHAHRVYLLSQMVGREYDIQDPYGGSRMEYASTAKELEELIDSGYERIVTLAEGSTSSNEEASASRKT